jgi:hypothetical protein
MFSNTYLFRNYKLQCSNISGIEMCTSYYSYILFQFFFMQQLVSGTVFAWKIYRIFWTVRRTKILGGRFRERRFIRI